MNVENLLRSRSLAIAALILATVLLAIGVQQAAVQTGDAEANVFAPLAIAVALSAAVLLAGRAVAGSRRTPYW